jgi:hypothetical protein
MRGYIGLCELGLLGYESVIVHIEMGRLHSCEVYLIFISPSINICLHTVLLVVGFVDNAEEENNSKVFSVSEASFVNLSVVSVEMV